MESEYVVRWNGVLRILHFGRFGKERRMHGHDYEIDVEVRYNPSVKVEREDIENVVKNFDYKLFLSKYDKFDLYEDGRVEIVKNRVNIIMPKEWIVVIDQEDVSEKGITKKIAEKIMGMSEGINYVIVRLWCGEEGYEEYHLKSSDYEKRYRIRWFLE